MSSQGSKPFYRGRSVVAWALYDCANSAYATAVLAGFFPIFFKQYWSGGVDAGTSTFQLGAANSIGSMIIVILAPVLGAIADQGGAKKRFLIFFAAMGVVMTGSLYWVAQGEWLLAVVLYVIASVGFSGGNLFYDSLIMNVADDEHMDVVSAMGYAFGYLGGGILFAANVFMTLHPGWFGLADASTAVRVSFVSVAVWWAMFSIPIMLFVHEPAAPSRRARRSMIKGGFGQLVSSLREVHKLHVVFLFLIAYWLYIDGVDTIVRMAVDYGLSLGFDANNLIVALLITQFIGFPAAVVFGQIGTRIGAKNGIYIAIAVYIAVCISGYFMDSVVEFYVIACVVGLVQGGIQALSRSFYTRIIPRDKAAEFFGFYNMLGKFAAVIGPLLMGWVSLATGNPRYSILSIIVLFIAGGVVLFYVDESQGRQAALDMENAQAFTAKEIKP